MLVKIKTKDIIQQTNKAILFLLKYEKEKWIPKILIKKYIGNSIIIPEWFAKKENLNYSNYLHIPKKIEPIFNQKPINEILC